MNVDGQQYDSDGGSNRVRPGSTNLSLALQMHRHVGG